MCEVQPHSAGRCQWQSVTVFNYTAYCVAQHGMWLIIQYDQMPAFGSLIKPCRGYTCSETTDSVWWIASVGVLCPDVPGLLKQQRGWDDNIVRHAHPLPGSLAWNPGPNNPPPHPVLLPLLAGKTSSFNDQCVIKHTPPHPTQQKLSGM